jgi:hypothetical protein
MPKTAIDYSKCCIYKIEHIDNESLVYVGHTTNFIKRKIKHKSCCNDDKNKAFNIQLYRMIRENGGWDNFKMIEVEKLNCNDKREAERRENEVMKELKANMNMIKSYIGKDEYKEYRKIKGKEYYLLNKEKIDERHKAYNKNNQIKIKEYYNKNKDKFKQYYLNNKEEIKETKKEYHLKNKSQISEKRKAKITCECGCEVNKSSIKRHQATKKHIDLMNKKI